MSGLARTFFSLEGTATRREWWIVNLVVAGVITLVMFLLMFQGGYELMTVMFDPLWGGLVGVLMWLPAMPVSVRRARARRLSLWWLVGALAWAAVEPTLIRTTDNADALVVGNVLQLAGLILSIFLLVQLGLLPSKAPPPEPDAAA